MAQYEHLPIYKKAMDLIIYIAGPRPYRFGSTGGAAGSERANAQANNYWSSTTYAGNMTNAWIVNMNDGNVNNDNKTNNNYVWPVRSGEWLRTTPPLNPLPSRGWSLPTIDSVGITDPGWEGEGRLDDR